MNNHFDVEKDSLSNVPVNRIETIRMKIQDSLLVSL